MTSYWEELALFFQKAAQEPNTEVILHLEPDMWGFLQRDSPGDNASNFPNTVQVSATGVAGLSGLPNNLSGLAQGYFALRDQPFDLTFVDIRDRDAGWYAYYGDASY